MVDFDGQLREFGYAFVTSPDMRAALESCGALSDWPAFAASWDDLEVDTYRTTGDRRRRFGVFSVDADATISRAPHQPHLQQPEYNALFGGVERWFSPIADGTAASGTLAAILRFCAATFGGLTVHPVAWRVEVHQFRIEAHAGLHGEPTPEGIHRDGVDFVLVLLVNRQNIVSGTTTVYDLRQHPLGSFTLSAPFDAALVDDHRVAHGVTPVAPLDRSRPGYRDVLVVTFRRTGSAGL